MATFSAFDDNSLDNGGPLSSEASRPFWTIKDDGDKAVLGWIASRFASLVEEARPRLTEAKKYLKLVSGVRNTDSTQSLQDATLGRSRGRKPPPMTCNHAWDLVETKVSTVSRFRPALSVTPATTDYQDRLSAQVVSEWVDYRAYVDDLDVFFQAAARLAFVTGEAYSMPDWDENLGDLVPEWKAEEKAAQAEGRTPAVPYLDAKGQPVPDENGNPRMLTAPVKQGDVKTVLLSMFDVFPVRESPDFSTWKEFFRIEFRDADEMKVDYPDLASKITPESQYTSRFDPISLQDFRANNKVMVLIYERMPDQYMPAGCVIKCLPQVILSSNPYYAHGRQPYSRFTDLDHPGDLWGQSFLKNVKAYSQTINDITSMARRAFLLVAHPKWAVPANSVVKKEQLGNDAGIVEFRGAQAPTIINSPVIPPDYFTFRTSLTAEMNQMAAISDVTRGNIPKRIESGIALQYLSEQTDSRANMSILKYQRFQRDTYANMLGVASKQYKKGDGRMLPIMGNSKKYELTEFDPSHLCKPMHIRFESASALPQSRAIRTQSLMDLKTAFPTLLSDKQVLDLLEFGQEDSFYDLATVSLRAAESKVQDLLLGKSVASPGKADDLLTIRDVIIRQMITRDFTENVPQNIVANVHDYLNQVECLCMERAQTNPVFAQALGQLDNFPIEFVASPDQLALVGRSIAATVNPASMISSTPTGPASALTSDPNAGAPPPASIPQPSAPAPTPNTIPESTTPPQMPQPPKA